MSNTIGYSQEMFMTLEEKEDMYMKLKKRELIEMLMENQRLLSLALSFPRANFEPFTPPIVSEKSNCMHDNCPDCKGTGRRQDGGICIHGMSCPCPKCTPQC